MNKGKNLYLYPRGFMNYSVFIEKYEALLKEKNLDEISKLSKELWANSEYFDKEMSEKKNELDQMLNLAENILKKTEFTVSENMITIKTILGKEKKSKIYSVDELINILFSDASDYERNLLKLMSSTEESVILLNVYICCV